jgi:peptide/nickel transport system ATP-binding protein
MSAEPLIALDNVSRTFGAGPGALGRLFGARGQKLHAVSDVALAVHPGEVVGLVGESGCGKSTLGRLAGGLLAPSAGRVLWRGKDRAALSPEEHKAARLAVQMIFQDPQSSLNPRLTVAEIVGEAPRVHRLLDGGKLDEYVDAQLRRAGLDPSLKRRYPHQFSGGQRQRIGIARALAVRPEMLVCDEAVAALDVSIQAQIINLLLDLRAELNLACLFISHDLGVVEHLSDRVAIMYLGRIVEIASTEEIFARPHHPYTRALLAQMPKISERRHSFVALQGELPSPLHPPSGCHFHPRCPHVQLRCRIEAPALREIAPAHVAACHLDAPG